MEHLTDILLICVVAICTFIFLQRRRNKFYVDYKTTNMPIKEFAHYGTINRRERFVYTGYDRAKEDLDKEAAAIIIEQLMASGLVVITPEKQPNGDVVVRYSLMIVEQKKK